jgi:hypothetical protein
MYPYDITEQICTMPTPPSTLNILYKYFIWHEINKGNAKRGVSPRLNIWPGDLDLWSMTLKINRVPDSLKD